MKTLLVLAFAAFALQVHSATITWGFGADVYLMKTGDSYTSAVLATDASAPEVTSGSFIALVYLGQNVSSFNIDDVNNDSIVASAPYKIDTTYAVDYDPYQTATATTDYDDGASFAVVWFDAGRSAFDYIYSIDDGSAFNQATVVSDMSPRGSAGILPAADTQGWGGVIAVPEPSTAALALAGLALLIKRRRA